MSFELLTFVLFAANALAAIGNVLWTWRQAKRRLSTNVTNGLTDRIDEKEEDLEDVRVRLDKLVADMEWLRPEQKKLFDLYHRLSDDLSDARAALRAAEANIEATRRLMEAIHTNMLPAKK